MQVTRRHFIGMSLAAGAFGVAPKLAFASLPALSRNLHFYNTHTGESLKTTYWENGAYDDKALESIAYVLRDFRTGDVHKMDPRLLDLLAALHARMDSAKPFEVISGYRSPKTNAMLHERTSGVARQSFHLQGMAIDIRLTDKPLGALRQCALDMQGGGVGFYPASDFIHVDTGPVRQW